MTDITPERMSEEQLAAYAGIIGGTPTQMKVRIDDVLRRLLAHIAWQSAFIGGSKVVRVSTDALRELQGIAAGTAGVEHVLILTGSNNLTIKHDSGSATGKRIYCHGSADITLAPNDILFLWFDATTDVWRAR